MPDRPGLRVEGALHRAQQAFLGVLDEYTLDQFLTRRSDLVPLLEGSLRRGEGSEGPERSPVD